MKKTILFALGLLTLGLSSCDMNKEPIGVLNEENAVESLSDIAGFRVRAYTLLRAITGGTYAAQSALQGDEFLGTIDNGNRGMEINGNRIVPSTDDVSGLFGGCYGDIANCNYILNKIPEVMAKGDFTAEDSIVVKRYIGEIRFIRAYHYYMLLNRYCQSPTLVSDWNNQLGVQIVTQFNPSQDRASYPARSSMAKTIAFIHEDLNAADSLINGFMNDPAGITNAEYSALKAPMAIYINPMTIKAFQARLALLEGRYQDVVNLSKEIIAGPYTLANQKKSVSSYRMNEVEVMWKYDQSNEIIFEPYANATEGRSGWGSLYIGNTEKDAYYIPTPYVIEDLYPKGDSRIKAYFSTKKMDYQGQAVTVPSFNKFPGNPELDQGETNDLCNKNKVFRLSEVYLNMAEAAYYLGDEATAKNAIITLRKARIASYRDNADQALSGEELLAQIKLERQRELIGEGFRITDLRRWKQGFTRTNNQYTKYPDAYLIVRGASLITVPGDNFRYVWPIPSEEFVNNPQVAGQQNPGY